MNGEIDMMINTSTSNFAHIYGKGYLYIDKTRFLAEWWRKGGDVTLITRPRRFGKSLLLSTVNYYFSSLHKDEKKEDGSPLFEGLDVWKDEGMRCLQGSVPVLSLTLSGCGKSVDSLARALSAQVKILYNKYENAIENSPLILTNEKIVLSQYHTAQYDPRNPELPIYALLTLCPALSKVYGNKPIILLDEYDTPLTEAFLEDSYADIVDYLRTLFVTCFKDNKDYSKILITGITRIAQQSLFSGFNNPCIDTMTDPTYPTVLGYTEEEVTAILQKAGLSEHRAEVKRNYEGYTIGTQEGIYNPYSLNYYLQKKVIRSYWLGTSSSPLVRDVIRHGAPGVQEGIAALMDGKTIRTALPTNLVYESLYNSEDAAYSLLYSSGYLTIKKADPDQTHIMETLDALDSPNTSGDEEEIPDPVYEVEIPNVEVRTIYKTILASWFGSKKQTAELVNAFHSALLLRDKNMLRKALRNIALSSFGEQDVANHPKRPPENFYHGIVLGLSLGLQGQYSIKSNYQAGDGIYDLTLTPRRDLPLHQSETLDPIVMEFKVKEKSDRTLEDAAKRAYDAIIQKNYTKPLTDLGIPEHRIWCVGIGFYEKYVSIVDATGPSENEYGNEITAEEHDGSAPAVKTEVPEANAILIQPASVAGFQGDIVELKVKTSDSGASYQWMSFEEGAEKWQKSRLRGNKTDTLSVPVNNVNTKKLYMCHIVFSNGEFAVTQKVKVSYYT